MHAITKAIALLRAPRDTCASARSATHSPRCVPSETAKVIARSCCRWYAHVVPQPRNFAQAAGRWEGGCPRRVPAGQWGAGESGGSAALVGLVEPVGAGAAGGGAGSCYTRSCDGLSTCSATLPPRASRCCARVVTCRCSPSHRTLAHRGASASGPRCRRCWSHHITALG